MKKVSENMKLRKERKTLIVKTARYGSKSKKVRLTKAKTKDASIKKGHVVAKIVERNVPIRTVAKVKTTKKSVIKKATPSCLNIAPVPPIPGSNKDKRTKKGAEMSNHLYRKVKTKKNSIR